MGDLSETYIGTIIPFAGTFAPAGWALCNGQLLAISQNETLYSLIGTTYGGDGINTFGMPNLCGRVPIHQGQLPGGSTYVIGQIHGSESVTILANSMPAHAHQGTIKHNNRVMAGDPGTSSKWDNLTPYPAIAPGLKQYGSPASNSNGLKYQVSPQNANNIWSPTGGTQAHENRQPYVVINFVIALTGLYPSRN